MKIGTRIAIINLAFMAIILMLLGLAWFELKTLDDVYNRSKAIATALRNQIEADMMHDSLRADVLYAIKLARDDNNSGKEEAIASTSENVENFKRLIRELEQANLSDTVNQRLAALKEPLERYTSSATQLTEQAFVDPQLIDTSYKSFEKDFEYLEGGMAKLSDVIEEEFNSVDEMVKTKKNQIGTMIGFSAILAFGITGLSWFFARNRIVKPIFSMTEVMRMLSQNELDTVVPYTDFKDEIGQMASAVQVFRENALETLRIKKEQEELEKSSVENRKRLMYELAHQFEGQVGSSIQSLAVAAERLQGSAKSMESTARTTQEASSSVAAASEETSANVATVASATEEMTASSQEISKQVANVAAKASEAADSANTTNQQVTALNTLVSNIGEVVTSIKNIAEQTNLLALNATIEAARAGESGKGFAVVADEVKKLATETAKKTEEIETRISEIQRATQASVQAMQLIIKNVSDIDNLSASAAAAVEEQNATITEITRNISEVSSAVRDVTSVIGSVQQGAVEVKQSAEALLEEADGIASLSDNLERSVSGFLKQIRGEDSVRNA